MSKNKNCLLFLPELYFWMGSFTESNNPPGFPSSLPFELFLDREIGLLSQRGGKLLEEILVKTYEYGSTVGNAMDDTPLGKLYCDDFLEFLEKQLQSHQKILEIGAGRGYLASRLKQCGHNVTAIEPGEINRPFWRKYNIDVIQDLFPSNKAVGPYDVIIFYGLLEHISDAESFLDQVKRHLSVDGVIVASVPNCSLEIETGDPSMLLHEHYHYFTPASISRLLKKNGCEVNIENSSHGRSIFVSAKYRGKVISDYPADEESSVLKEYPEKVNRLHSRLSSIFRRAVLSGSVGIYCPARALTFLPQDIDVRFFDDALDLHEKYYPPFRAKIESREDLLTNPVDILFVMSMTFGDILKTDLSLLLPQTTICTIMELV